MRKIFYMVCGWLISIQQVFADFSLIPEDGKIIVKEKGLICDFYEGEFSFGCLPYYIKYLIEGIIGLAGTIALIFIMIGGFKYISSSVTDDKEAGKETIKNAVIGLVIAGLAWIIVTMLVSLLTM